MERVDLFVECRYLLRVEEKSFVEDGAFAAKDGRIVWVGKRGEKEFISGETLKLDRHIVLPAFVNTHTHAAMVGMRGLADDLPLKTWLEEHIWPAEGRWVTREFIEVMVPLAIAEMVRAGITTYADMYFFEDTAAQIVKKMGVRAVLGEGVIDFPTPSFKKPDDALSFTREFIEEYREDEQIYPAVAPHAPYTCSGELLMESHRLSEEYGVPLLIHVAETKWEREEVTKRHGAPPFRYLYNLGILNNRLVAAHAVWVDKDEMKLLKETGTGISHNPSSNMKLASGFAPVPEYLENGIKTGIGTDGAASNNNLNFLEEMHLASLIHKGYTGEPTVLKAEEVVWMGTLGGAQVLSLDDKIGSLETGKYADFIAIRIDSLHMVPIFNPYSHLVYTAQASDIEYVYAFGRALIRDGNAVLWDEDGIKNRVAEFLERLI